MKTLLDSAKYKKFTQDRNKALEQINLNTQLDISRMTFEVLDRITGYVSHMAISRQVNVYTVQALSNELDHFISSLFAPTISQISHRIMRMRRHTFMLTYLGELEAIARATNKEKPISLSAFKMKLDSQVKQDTLTGQALEMKTWQTFFNLKQKILGNFVRAIINGLNSYEVVTSVKNSYPEIKAYKRPPRAIKPIREADKPEGKEFDFYFGLTNDQDWDEALQAYKDTELPASRFDMQASTFDPEASYFKYDWELEQAANDDFVQQVRDGQVEAANDLGIKEFVWIAIIDNKTCEVCCLPRNGKTTSEIQKMLNSGELDKLHCDAITPPAHPNCRCDIGPVASTQEVQGPNWKDFGEWLES